MAAAPPPAAIAPLTPTPHSLATAAFLAAVRMANLAHNLAQRDTPPDDAEWQVLRRRMRENQEMWDAGEATVRRMVAAGAVSPAMPSPLAG